MSRYVLTEQAEQDLEESQVMYRVSLAHAIKAFIYWGLGDLPGSGFKVQGAGDDNFYIGELTPTLRDAQGVETKLSWSGLNRKACYYPHDGVSIDSR